MFLFLLLLSASSSTSVLAPRQEPQPPSNASQSVDNVFHSHRRRRVDDPMERRRLTSKSSQFKGGAWRETTEAPPAGGCEKAVSRWSGWEKMKLPKQQQSWKLNSETISRLMKSQTVEPIRGNQLLWILFRGIRVNGDNYYGMPFIKLHSKKATWITWVIYPVLMV